MEVIIPIESVMAKPLIGPEPNPKRMTAAISVVMFASAIVATALA